MNTENVSAEKMHAEFLRILLAYEFQAQHAETCARVFTENSVDGVLTHGVNRFARFIRFVQSGWVVPNAQPTRVSATGAIEVWNGQLGPGPLNARHSTQRAVELARANGIGCVAMSHTNHWMRAGYYGREAAQAGCALIAWTNTNANLPAWGATECRLGNNPIVFAVPNGDSPVVLDMAVSQFSHGKLAVHARSGEPLSHPGGFDAEGHLTTDARAIRQSKRALPIGYWKGAGLSLLLDILATVLSGGLSTHELAQREDEFGVSQVFIAIDLARFPHSHAIPQTIAQILDDYKLSATTDGEPVIYPGERVEQTRQRHLAEGIPVEKQIWEEVLAL